MEVKDINFAAMPQTAVRVVTAPAEFFKTMPKTGGFVEPLVFAVIMGVIAGIIQAIINIFGLSYAHVGFVESLGMIILCSDFCRYRQFYRCCYYLCNLAIVRLSRKL